MCKNTETGGGGGFTGSIPDSTNYFFPRFDGTHCDRIHSSLTAVHCFDNRYVGKQPVAWEGHSVEYLLNELQESTDKCTGHHDIIEIIELITIK